MGKTQTLDSAVFYILESIKGVCEFWTLARILLQGIRRKKKAHLGRNRSTAASTNQKSPRIVQARTKSKFERTSMGTFRVIVIPQKRKKENFGNPWVRQGLAGRPGVPLPQKLMHTSAYEFWPAQSTEGLRARESGKSSSGSASFEMRVLLLYDS